MYGNDDYKYARTVSKANFIQTVTSICQFHANNYYNGGRPDESIVDEDGTLAVSYVLACWFAQHFLNTGGVDTGEAMEALKMTQHMDWDARKKLVVEWYKEFADR